MIRYGIKKTASVFTALCLVLMLAMVSVFSAWAVEERKGSIEIYLRPELEGMPISLYEIGTVENGEFVLNDQFKELDLKKEYYQNNDALKDKLEQAEKDILAMNIYGDIARVDMDGYVTYRDLDINKLYFLLQPIGGEIAKISPMLIAIPQADGTGKVIYDIKGNGKAAERAGEENCGAVILTKTNQEDVPLEGAVFTLWSKVYYTDDSKYSSDEYEKGSDDQGNYYWKFIAEKTTDKNGQIPVDRMDFGQYRFVEEKAPVGYKLDAAPHEFDVSEVGNVKLENDIYVTESGQPVFISVVNMPETGESQWTPSQVVSDESIIAQDSYNENEMSDKTSYPTPSKASEVSTHKIQITPDITVEVTGDDIVKYIAIGGIVVASLILVIILTVLGGNKKDKKNSK